MKIFDRFDLDFNSHFKLAQFLLSETLTNRLDFTLLVIIFSCIHIDTLYCLGS